MKVSSVITFLSLTLAVSALAKNNNANADAADQLVAAPGVNDAANNGAKGDEAAALAQEAVDEFESGQAVTATAADATATANVAKENAAIAGKSGAAAKANVKANARAAADAEKKAKGQGQAADAKNNAGAKSVAANATADASANAGAADQLVAASGVNDAANNGAKGDEAAAIAQEAVDEFESGQAVTATAADAQATANVVKENAAIKKAGERRFRA